MTDDQGDVMGTTNAFDEALASFTRLAAAPEVGAAWESDSVLAGYSVGGLTAHVVQGVAWLAAVAAQGPAEDEALRVVDAGGYFATMKREPEPGVDAMHDAIVSMGNAGAAHGWEPTVEHLRSTGTRASAAIAAGDVERIVDLRPTLPFGTSLRTFVATRVVELVVHGDDLAVSVGRDGVELDARAFEEAASMLVATAAAQHDRLAVLRAVTRRERTRAEVFPVF